jgi:hypothetical protein
MFSPKLVKALLKITKNAVGKEVLQHFEVKDGVTTLTDGHRMVNIQSPDEIDGLYHHDEIEVATKIATAKKTEVVLSSLIKGEPGQYPNWERLIPSTEDDRKVAFSPEYLKQMCELAIASNATAIEFHIPPHTEGIMGEAQCTKPVLCFWKVGESIARGLLMPIQMRYGFLKWETSPKKAEKSAVAA